MTKSLALDFQRTPLFFDNWNNNFKVSDMNTGNNFKFVFASSSAENIDFCLNGNIIDTVNVTIVDTEVCSLKWENEVISVREDVVWDIGDTNESLQSVFLTTGDDKCVLGYSIFKTPYNVTNQVIIEADTVLWSIVDGN